MRIASPANRALTDGAVSSGPALGVLPTRVIAIAARILAAGIGATLLV